MTARQEAKNRLRQMRASLRQYRATASHLAEQRANVDRDDPEARDACREWLAQELHASAQANRLEDLILQQRNELADL